MEGEDAPGVSQSASTEITTPAISSGKPVLSNVPSLNRTLVLQPAVTALSLAHSMAYGAISTPIAGMLLRRDSSMVMEP